MANELSDKKKWKAGSNLGKAQARATLGKPYEAIKYFDKALSIEPDMEVVWCEKSMCLAEIGRIDEAIECLDKALSIDPNSLPAWTNKGSCFGMLGRYREALECYDNAISIDPFSQVDVGYCVECPAA
ncbi:MAG: tetratricopeptide repeat protein [Actinobacteria bacterium]|nr:tetratricopeptide repeat protein [Actinomycetota bacterium]